MMGTCEDVILIDLVFNLLLYNEGSYLFSCPPYDPLPLDPSGN